MKFTDGFWQLRPGVTALYAQEAYDIWTQITCPVLLLRGTESWASDPEKDGRAEAFRDYTYFNIENAGHWVHHDQLAIFLKLVREFLGVA